MYENYNNTQNGPNPSQNGFPPYQGNPNYMPPIPPGDFQNRPEQIYQNPYSMPPPIGPNQGWP